MVGDRVLHTQPLSPLPCRARTCQLRDIGQAEPVCVVAAAPEDFTDLTLAEEELDNCSVETWRQPGPHGERRRVREGS